MKDWFFRYFARILAVLGCSTLVTACYGVPYETYQVKISGKVLDSVTGKPVKGIQIKLTPGTDSYQDAGTVNGVHPLSSPFAVISGTDGRFSATLHTDIIEPDGVLVECLDVDGAANGSYLPESQVFKNGNTTDVELRLDRDNE